MKKEKEEIFYEENCFKRYLDMTRIRNITDLYTNFYPSLNVCLYGQGCETSSKRKKGFKKKEEIIKDWEKIKQNAGFEDL
ncbi:MAG TPA: hypothetical protein ENG87_03890 [Candidatus Pacearchaeota archaeon]|nr:hypothetical protein [Candidatus Pacearchaeota archaeon]